MSRRAHLAWPIGLALLLACPEVRAATVLSGFSVENAFPGVHFTLPTALAYLPDGRLLVAEKRGVVWVVDHGVLRPQPLWSAEREVLANGDRGLIGIAVDPRYTLNHRVYFYYTADPDSDGVDDEGGAFTRLARYTTSAADSNVVDPASRTLLLGVTWSAGIPSPSLSHAVDCLRFGSDGSLLVTHGDGSHFEYPDWGGHDPDVFLPGRTNPLEDIGSFRSQYLNSLAGKLLRINPENGHGYASNPYVAGDLTAPRAKVWAYGLRNPFRFVVRPGTGSADTTAGDPGVLYVGDVGATTWEELDVAGHGGMNFGWPCREGLERYATLDTVTPARAGCDAIGGVDDPASPTAPTFAWHHTDSTRSLPYGIRGNCTSGGVFYTGTRYPDAYRGRLFFGDYGSAWLRVATVDGGQAVTSLQDFASGLDTPVDWALDPVSEEIVFVALTAGEIRRIRWVGGGDAARVVARASASALAAASPATIAFSSLGSYDTGGGTVSFAWSFGDDTPGTAAPFPTHTYTAGTFAPILTVTRADGALARDTLHLVVLRDSAIPVTAVVDSFAGPDRALAAPWVGNLNGLAIRDHALTETGSSNYAMWGTAFGANQEVHVRFDSLAPTAPEHDLLLKVQGTSWTAGAIQVVYDVTGHVIAISTYDPAVGWAHIVGPWRGITFRPGDTFSARALSNGVLQVFRNDELLGDCRVDRWRFAGAGGRVGLMLKGANGSRLTRFGGGDLSTRDNAPPEARILEPLPGGFYVAGGGVRLRAEATDPDGPDSSLRYHWDVTLHHNNHLHPDVVTSDAAVDSFVAENHDDCTGVSLIATLTVRDAHGAADTASVELYPETNLTPHVRTVTPAYPTGGDAVARFAIVNTGRMPAPRARWRLRLDGALQAEGDTVVAARDSVVIDVRLAAAAATAHIVRVETDVLGQVHETDETDDNREVEWAPLPFPTALLLDAFDRADGTTLPLSAPWVGSVAGLAVRDGALVQTAPVSYAIWNGTRFGADQEAFVRFDSVTAAAPEHSLLLKVQRTAWTGGALQVAYSVPTTSVSVYTYSPTAGWIRRAGPWRGVAFAPGDQFGARATAAGTVTVFRNGVAIGATSLGNWEFAGLGGRIGVMLRGADRTRLIDFGGGDVIDGPASRPHASIVSPATRCVVPAGDTLVLRGAGADAEDPAAALRFRWRIRLPGGAVTRRGAMAACPLPDTVAGPVPVQLIVTDCGGRTDTTAVAVVAGARALDRFDRADGAPGASWFGASSAFAIRDSALVLNGASGYLTWNPAVFGAAQEAWMEFDSVAVAAREHDLLLDVQGPSWSAGAIQVTSTPSLSQVVVNTYSPGTGWTRRAGPWRNVSFAPGDRLGARAFPDGRVEVYRNGVAIGTGSVAPWPGAASGGRIGLILNGAAGTRVRRFGGGTIAGDSTFVVAGDAAPLSGAAEGAAGLPGPAAEPRVSPAMPNPASGVAMFSIELPRADRVGIAVYDVSGREVWGERERPLEAGRWTLRWPARDRRGEPAPVGIYLARISIGDRTYLRRLSIVR